MKSNIIVFLASVFAFALVTPALAQVTLPGPPGCSGGLLCDTTLTCDINAQSCTTSYSNCRACPGGAQAVSCPGGATVFASQVCVPSLGGATCRTDPNACSASSGVVVNEPNVVLRFNVFTQQDIIVTIDPPSVTAVAGSTMNYRLSVSNPMPVRMTFFLTSSAPEHWNVTIQNNVTVNADSSRDAQFSVRSPANATNNAYTITIALIEPSFPLFLTADAEYVIGLRGAPEVVVSPPSQEGLPGQTLTYTVSVTNRDPPGFDASTIFLRAVVPQNWFGRVANTSLRLAPGETGTTTLDATSFINATDKELVGVNATANTRTSVAFAEYVLNFCGDNVCSASEDSSICAADCPLEPVFKCNLKNNRCEEEIDDGVHFASNVSMLVNKFVICSKRFTQQQCEAAFDARQCGLDKACLCGDRLGETECNTLCVDTRGFYYLYARGGSATARSLANYTYSCPFVDLADFRALRNDFADSLESFEQAYSGMLETVTDPQATEQVKARFQPCLDAHAKIISDIGNHIAYMDAVILHPAKSNTTQARERSTALKTTIQQLQNQFCALGVSGLLKIDSVTPPELTEINTNATTTVNVRNIGTLNYFGFVSCNFNLGSRREQANSTCKTINSGDTLSESLTFNPVSAGRWSIACTTYGSFQSDCSQSSPHFTAAGSFDAYTKDVYVVDVNSTCGASEITCAVRTNSPQDCAACKVNLNSTSSIDCTKISQNGTVALFSCPAKPGFTNLTGYVTSGGKCNPVTPTQKTASAYCPGCGSGRIDIGETCELPNTDNNSFVRQEAGLSCDGKKSVVRDSYGFCTPTCQSSADQPTPACAKNSCGAQCSEGETKTLLIASPTNPLWTCRATQQCGETCEFLPATCEPRAPGANQTTERNGTIALMTAHYPAGNITTNTTVTITGFADSSNVHIEIFLDGVRVQSCNTAQCDFISKINTTGVHTYYATLSAGAVFVRSPAAGAKSFVVLPPGATRPCEVTLLSASCSYDSDRNIYNITASASWSAAIGDHGHIDISNDDGFQKFFTSNMSTSRIASAGIHPVRALVHDAGDNAACSDERDVICGAGTSSDGVVSIVREFEDVVPIGGVPVRFKIVTNDDVALKFTEHVPAGLAVTNLEVSDLVADVVTTKNVEIDGVTYDTYSWTRNLNSGDAMEFSYTVNLPEEREYTFTSLAEFGSEQQREEFTVFASSCAQIGKVYAVSPNGQCQSFRTSCDVFQGWTIVAECPIGGEAEPPEETSLFSLLPVVIIIIILGLAYVYRAKIKEWLQEWRAGGIVKKMKKVEYGV